MADFTIRTVDSEYTWNSDSAVNKTGSVIFDDESNNSNSETQGFLNKKQIGQSRTVARFSTILTQEDYEEIFIPGLTYDDDWVVTFDRHIPSTGTSTGTFSFEDIRKLRDDLADGYNEVEMLFREII